jgi:hypothetical protein
MPSEISTGRRPGLAVRIVAWGFTLLVSAVIVELGARWLSPPVGGEKEALMARLYAAHYSAQELDRSLPFNLPRQGGECVTYRLDRLHWNPWWGYAAKRLDPDCAAKLFARHPIKVVLLGGSALFNAEAPNHLTQLDYLAFGQDERIASINLAESGARLSNMLARFIHEVIQLKPDIAVFMDGFNEFNAVRYGGPPGDDFYWTAGVRRRIEEPVLAALDKLVEASAFFRIALVHSGLHRSARAPQVMRGPPDHRADVAIYLRDREVLAALCAAYRIKCLFVLQPTAFTTTPQNANLREVLAQHAYFFPHDAALYANGYAAIQAQPCPTCIDAANLLAGLDDAYFDIVHFTKLGGARIGRAIYDAVIAAHTN